MLRFILILIMFILTLFAGDRAQQIADELRSLAGQTLDRTVLFVRYGEDRFDWLAVTPDGKFVAKLEGMNPDGSFRYTILGDPAKYGIHLQVSLTGVKISTSSALQRTKKIQNANLAIRALIIDQTFTQGTSSIRGSYPMRSFPFVVLPDTLFKGHPLLRAVALQTCPDGGSVTVRVNGDGTEVDFRYQSCRYDDTTIDGLMHLRTYDQSHFDGYYQNLSVKTNRYRTYIQSATISLDLDRNELANLRLEIPEGTIHFLRNDRTIFIRNYSLTLKQRSKSIFMDVTSDYRADCQPQWSHATTIEPIVVVFHDRCPTAGVVEITNSQQDLRILFNEDSSIDLIDHKSDSLLHRYPDCHSIPEQDFCED